MDAYIYIYKHSVKQGRPSWGWLYKSRWYFLKWEESERFKHILSVLERWNVPMVPIGRDNRIRGYLVIKAKVLREFINLVVQDLLYDAIISDERIRSLEDGTWDVEMVRSDVKVYALWRLGLMTKAENKLTEVREVYRELIRALKEARDEKVQVVR
jgi:hypothetical protein